MFSLSLTNFRSFEFETLNFSKINILIGENSSGKSSLFKLILALKQTLQAPQNREINLAFTGEYADLGSYKESIYYHDDNLPMTVKFSVIKNYEFFFDRFMIDKNVTPELAEKEKEKLRRYIGKTINSPTDLSYTFNKYLDRHETIQTSLQNPQIGKLEIFFTENEEYDEDNDLLFGYKCNLKYFDFQLNREFLCNQVEYQKDGFMTIIVSPSLRTVLRNIFEINESSYGNKSDIITKENQDKFDLSEAIYHRMAYLLVTQNFLKYYLDKIDYINPIFTKPSRVYLYRDSKQLAMIKDIEDVVEFFSRSSEISKLTFRDFVKVLKDFGIADDVEIIKDDRLPVRELRVKVQDLLSNITDVGYGVSLQLPIILKAILSERLKSRRNSVILIEQPEVHLHPKLHAQLMDVILSLSRYTTYFIETHSEHMIRKLQVLIKQKKYNLSPDDVTIHYLRRVDKKTIVTSHRILEDGQLQPSLPSGFFDNSYQLAKSLLD